MSDNSSHMIVSDIAVFVLKRDAKLQPTFRHDVYKVPTGPEKSCKVLKTKKEKSGPEKS